MDGRNTGSARSASGGLSWCGKYLEKEDVRGQQDSEGVEFDQNMCLGDITGSERPGSAPASGIEARTKNKEGTMTWCRWKKAMGRWVKTTETMAVMRCCRGKLELAPTFFYIYHSSRVTLNLHPP